MRLIGALLVFVGCSSGGVMTPLGDAPIDDDGTPHALGVSVSWKADPRIPNTFRDKVEVKDVTFRLAYLQVVTDLLMPDETTTRSNYTLHWDMQGAPPQDKFPDAPIATYRKASISLRSNLALGEPMFEINGMWEDEDNAVVKPFKLVDPVGVLPPIALPFTKQLTAGGSISIQIKVDIKDAVESVDFGKLREAEGMLVLDGGAALVALRARMADVFKLDHD